MVQSNMSDSTSIVGDAKTTMRDAKTVMRVGISLASRDFGAGGLVSPLFS